MSSLRWTLVTMLAVAIGAGLHLAAIDADSWALVSAAIAVQIAAVVGMFRIQAAMARERAARDRRPIN